MAKRTWLGVFDRPVWRDWAFWNAIFWTMTMGVSTAFDPPEDSTSPLIVDVLGVSAVAFFVIGWPIAGVRWIVRRMRRRSEPKPSNYLPYLAGPAASGPTPIPPATAVLPPPAPYAAPTQQRNAPPAPARHPAAETAEALSLHRSIPVPPVPPPPLSAYRGANMADSAPLSFARSAFPYPVARACRAVQGTQDPLEQYQHLIDLADHLSITIGMLSAAWLRAYDPDNQALVTLLSAYQGQGVSQGHWHVVIDAARSAMTSPVTAFPGFTQGFGKRYGHALMTDLKTMVEERNRASHGARPNTRPEAAVRTTEIAPIVERAIERASFLAEVPWVLVESVAMRRQDRRWNVRVKRAMGDHPEFDAATVVFSHALANDTFYVMTEPEPLDLTPMIVMRYCDQCRQPEVCHSDRIHDNAGVSLKSFARGHQVFDRDLVAEFDSFALSGQQPLPGGAS